jgi:gamma-glutamylcyclotransferase (GGCT)/AIG2-like uncharacterized protein YtfP
LNAPATKLLFVYGTLKHGCSNHPFLAGQQFIDRARTAPGYRLFDLGAYPAMVAVPDDTEGVTGEVWSVDAPCLAEIDFLEGIDQGLYRREPVPLLAPFDGEAIDTYVYALRVEGYPDLGSTWKE